MESLSFSIAIICEPESNEDEPDIGDLLVEMYGNR